MMNLDQWDKTAHAKSYVVDTSEKYTEYFFEKDVCSSVLIKCCLKKDYFEITYKPNNFEC